MTPRILRGIVGLALAALLTTTGGCAALAGSSSGLAADAQRPEWFGADDEQAVAAAEEDEGHSLGHRLLFWIPNRIFDVFDMVRARLRLGPGFGLSVRATEFADVSLGAYTTVWVGIHGPRGRPGIPWPAWLEIYAGAGVSVVELSTEDGLFSPHYGWTEFGLGAQLAIIGFDVGVDPLEIVDFVVGIFTFDIIGDDF
ncbi:MAG: hypothetical protein H6825_10190 [Planctomycetes bacterium]|nr:hypothetical protein [Planctomycetota bacterium]